MWHGTRTQHSTRWDKQNLFFKVRKWEEKVGFEFFPLRFLKFWPKLSTYEVFIQWLGMVPPWMILIFLFVELIYKVNIHEKQNYELNTEEKEQKWEEKRWLLTAEPWGRAHAVQAYIPARKSKSKERACWSPFCNNMIAIFVNRGGLWPRRGIGVGLHLDF